MLVHPGKGLFVAISNGSYLLFVRVYPKKFHPHASSSVCMIPLSYTGGSVHPRGRIVTLPDYRRRDKYRHLKQSL